ncbi:MAG: PD40 domain-containing protein [Gemmatimonadetes bacterium]|nr:PD40 domain-containing protein [Gemmatimonadota bacterium]
MKETKEGKKSWPDALPDGRGLLLTVYRGSPEQSQIAVVGPEGGEVRELFQGTMARYAASGHVVYATADGTLMAAPFDLKSLEVTGPAVGLVEGVRVKGGSASQFALSQTGTLLYKSGRSVGGESEFVWVTRSGLAEPVAPGWSLDSAPGGNFGWRLSPDDGRLVFQKAVEGNTDIWVKVLPDGPESRLTFSEAVDRMPRWAPDGQTITFRSDRTEPGVGHLWSKRADGTGEAEVLFDGFAVAMGFWGPDGEWLVLRRAGNSAAFGARDILAMRPGVDSVALPLIVNEVFREQGPAFSPDGRWLAYSSNETGRTEVFVRPFPDVESGKWQVSTEGGIKPLWAHSGRELFYRTADNNLIAVQVVRDPAFSLGTQRLLFSVERYRTDAFHRAYDVTRDDQRFVMIRQEVGEDEGELILVLNWLEEVKRQVGNE